MKLVIADTGPVHYLVLIEQIHLLPSLFERVSIPVAVHREMLNPKTPDSVRQWIQTPPSWLQILPDPTSNPEDSILAELDNGERAAIDLAITVGADLVLTDDRAAVIAAKEKALLVTGTLGVLGLAAERGLVEIDLALDKLTATNFRYAPALIEHLRKAHRSKPANP